jgi:metal-responsive CopG/Arc/MetJ family transcriptional regulator
VRYRVRMRVRTNLMLPDDLVAEVDRLAGPRNRSRFVEDAIRERVRRAQLREAVEQTAGALRAEDYPHWATSDDVVGWVRASRAEVTDSGG